MPDLRRTELLRTDWLLLPECSVPRRGGPVPDPDCPIFVPEKKQIFIARPDVFPAAGLPHPLYEVYNPDGNGGDGECTCQKPVG